MASIDKQRAKPDRSNQRVCSLGLLNNEHTNNKGYTSKIPNSSKEIEKLKEERMKHLSSSKLTEEQETAKKMIPAAEVGSEETVSTGVLPSSDISSPPGNGFPFENIFEDFLQKHGIKISDIHIELSHEGIKKNSLDTGQEDLEIECIQPWNNEELMKEILKKRDLFKRAKRTQYPDVWEEFREQRTKVTHMIRAAKLVHEGTNLAVEDKKVYCDPCDQGFPGIARLINHRRLHEKCTYDGCRFEGLGYAIQTHKQMQHFTEDTSKIWKIRSAEEIEKWKEERKMNFPSSEKVAKRQAEQDLKIDFNFICDACDRCFTEKNDLDIHCNLHQKCTFDDCKYEGLASELLMHVEMQHKSGHASQIWNLVSLEEINKWRKERKKHFPLSKAFDRHQAHDGKKDAKPIHSDGKNQLEKVDKLSQSASLDTERRSRRDGDSSKDGPSRINDKRQTRSPERHMRDKRANNTPDRHNRRGTPPKRRNSHSLSRSPSRHNRSRSRSNSLLHSNLTRSPTRHQSRKQSPLPRNHNSSRSVRRSRSSSPLRRTRQRRSRSPLRRSRSPVHRVRSPLHRSRSPGRRIRSPLQRSRSRSLGRRVHSPVHRVRSPVHRSRSRTPARRIRSRSRTPSRRIRSRSRSPSRRTRSPLRRSQSPSRRVRSPLRQSPVHHSRSPSRRSRNPSRRSRSRSPVRRTRSPLHHSSVRRNRSPTRRSQSPLYHRRGPLHSGRGSPSPKRKLSEDKSLSNKKRVSLASESSVDVGLTPGALSKLSDIFNISSTDAKERMLSSVSKVGLLKQLVKCSSANDDGHIQALKEEMFLKLVREEFGESVAVKCLKASEKTDPSNTSSRINHEMLSQNASGVLSLQHREKLTNDNISAAGSSATQGNLLDTLDNDLKVEIAQQVASILASTGQSAVSDDILAQIVQQAIALKTKVPTSSRVHCAEFINPANLQSPSVSSVTSLYPENARLSSGQRCDTLRGSTRYNTSFNVAKSAQETEDGFEDWLNSQLQDSS